MSRVEENRVEYNHIRACGCEDECVAAMRAATATKARASKAGAQRETSTSTRQRGHSAFGAKRHRLGRKQMSERSKFATDPTSRIHGAHKFEPLRRAIVDLDKVIEMVRVIPHQSDRVADLQRVRALLNNEL